MGVSLLGRTGSAPRRPGRVSTPERDRSLAALAARSEVNGAGSDRAVVVRTIRGTVRTLSTLVPSASAAARAGRSLVAKGALRASHQDRDERVRVAGPFEL